MSRQPDPALLTVKTRDVVAAQRENVAMLRNVPIVVLQNGLRAEELAATVVTDEQLLSGVASLHAQRLVPDHVVLMQSQGLPIGRNDVIVERCHAVLDKAVPTFTTTNIVRARWTKLTVSLNNVLPALMRELIERVHAHAAAGRS